MWSSFVCVQWSDAAALGGSSRARGWDQVAPSCEGEPGVNPLDMVANQGHPKVLEVLIQASRRMGSRAWRCKPRRSRCSPIRNYGSVER